MRFLIRHFTRQHPASLPNCMLIPFLWCWIRESELSADGIPIRRLPIWASPPLWSGTCPPNRQKAHNSQTGCKGGCQWSRLLQKSSTMIMKWVKRRLVIVIHVICWSWFIPRINRRAASPCNCETVLKRQVRPVFGPVYTHGLSSICNVFFYFSTYIHSSCPRIVYIPCSYI